MIRLELRLIPFQDSQTKSVYSSYMHVSGKLSSVYVCFLSVSLLTINQAFILQVNFIMCKTRVTAVSALQDGLDAKSFTCSSVGALKSIVS